MKITNKKPTQRERDYDARAREAAEESQRVVRKMKQEAGARQPQVLKAGAVAAPDVYSAHEAEAVLAEGGNAVDAAVAAAFVLAVTYPEAGNIGGGGFMNIHYDGSPYFLDYRECAPANARRDMYLDEAGEVVPGMCVVGRHSVAVPGTVRGLWDAHRRFGSLPWRRLVAPAIRYAKLGFIVHRQLIERRDVMLADFEGKTNFTQFFGKMEEGGVFRQPDLANTLERIARYGVGEFYLGVTADLLVKQLTDLDVPITKDDLRQYRTIWRKPLVADWNGYQVVTAPPPSSGGIGLLQLLKMKDVLSAAFAGVEHNSTQYVHLFAEMSKRVFADRAEYLGDPAFQEMPVDALLHPAYIRRRAAEVDLATPTPVDAVQPGLEESEETTHFSIVDKFGNAVSNTYTLNSKFGSGIVVEGAGFLLNNDMDDFSAKPGAANRFDLVGTDANAIAPGKRMLSSMTPTILTKDGRVSIVIGTPGGSRIFGSIFQVLSNLHSFDMSLAKAVAKMRVHHQLLPVNTVYWEPYAPIEGALADELLARGYNLRPRFTNGDIQVIRVDGDMPEAASDPRARGTVRLAN
ncbi:gamma-glutamyltranspeptidase [Burkholderia stagnalis]|nr:gamma-glutamyltranspeptidase [Burkholderia stagnalis]KVP15421.1 gamma-glutamyltranspeptidase [Burkholderia stagnalis]KVW94093.1 gamma-glutamyltranspeptidase [Burkholderia stagnalis]KWH77169.1 gamma-glutamyltranspeptidase [Burkholderia stagnalis]KWK24334.1 gamma-glutamyltranspeptidase [Burkholderia stagnalis]